MSVPRVFAVSATLAVAVLCACVALFAGGAKPAEAEREPVAAAPKGS